MKINLIIFLGLLFACQSKNQTQILPPAIEPDTVIIKIDMNHKLAGSAYRNRATGYRLVVKGDSSLYYPSFTESKDNGSLSLMLGLHPQLTYAEQMKQLEALLPAAARDYNFDSLSGVFMGRLVQCGDMAIEVTNEYLTAFGGYGSTATTEYDAIANFIASSKLGQHINALFATYGLEVAGASVEKVFYTQMYKPIKIDSSLHTKFPDRVLDAMVWIKLEKRIDESK